MNHHPMIIIVSGYSLARKISMEILIGGIGFPPLFARNRGIIPKRRVFLTSVIWFSFEMLSLSWVFPSIMYLLGCHLISLSVNEVL